MGSPQIRSANVMKVSERRFAKISAVGDISFADNPHQFTTVLDTVKPLWVDSDVAVANLESPFLTNGSAVRGKCVLRGDPRWARYLSETGVTLVSLANNHIMDFGVEGLVSTVNVLDQAGVRHVGAGMDKVQASAPLIVETRGVRFAFLGRSAVIVSSPCYATKERPGVALLDVDEIKRSVQDCKGGVDFVVLLVHWGIERYVYPSPAQRVLARELASIGCDVILGHHPHVLQGAERIGRTFVAYSLGDFIFSDVVWSFDDVHGEACEVLETVAEESRKSAVLQLDFSRNGITSQQFYTTLLRKDGIVCIDESPGRADMITRLSSELQRRQYGLFWFAYSLIREWQLRLAPLTIDKLSWARLKKLRARHFVSLAIALRRAYRVTREKTTNPYE